MRSDRVRCSVLALGNMYEHRRLEPISTRRFRRRVLVHSLWILVILAGSLGLGTLGYHYFGQLAWIDAFLDASMILSGMGPVNVLHSTSAKVFAALYAIFSGVVFIGVAGILIAPFAHRVLHRFHWEESSDKS